MKHILITLIIAGVASANSLPPCPYNTYNTLPPTWELTSNEQASGDFDTTTING